MIVGAVALAAIGTTFLERNRAQHAEAQLAVLAADRDGLRSQLAAEQQRARRVVQEPVAPRSNSDAPKAKPLPADRPAPPDQPSPPRPGPRRGARAGARAVRENGNGRLSRRPSGQEPPNPKALISYFATPQDGADWVEFLEAQKAAKEN